MPQPVDMQSELGRIHTAERIQEIAGRAASLGQLRVSDETEKARRAAETNTQETARPHGEHVERDGKRRNPFVGTRRKRETHAGNGDAQTIYGPNEQAKILDDGAAHTLDVSV